MSRIAWAFFSDTTLSSSLKLQTIFEVIASDNVYSKSGELIVAENLNRRMKLNWFMI